jgi:small membrane protein
VIIKLLLLGALALAAYSVMHGRATALSLLLRRVATMLAIGVGATAVVFPDLVTYVANAVGVGRGTDLLLYLLCVAFLFTSIGLHMRLARINDKYVELARQVALAASRDDATRAQAELVRPRSGDLA